MFQHLMLLLQKSTFLHPMKNHLHYCVVTAISNTTKLTCVLICALGERRKQDKPLNNLLFLLTTLLIVRIRVLRGLYFLNRSMTVKFPTKLQKFPYTKNVRLILDLPSCSSIRPQSSIHSGPVFSKQSSHGIHFAEVFLLCRQKRSQHKGGMEGLLVKELLVCTSRYHLRAHVRFIKLNLAFRVCQFSHLGWTTKQGLRSHSRRE